MQIQRMGYHWKAMTTVGKIGGLGWSKDAYVGRESLGFICFESGIV